MKRPSLTVWILIALVAGIAFGAAFPGPAKELGLLGTIFLRLIKSIIAPLIFATLVVGIAGTGSIKTMGRIGGKAILYFEIVTTLALVIGLGAANLVQPGAGVALTPGRESRRRRHRDRLAADRRAHVSHQHYRRDGPGRSAPDRGVFIPVRHRLRGHPRKIARRGRLLPGPFRRDVPLHQLCDAARSAGSVRGHGGHHRRQRAGSFAESWQAGADALRHADVFHRGGPGLGHRHRADPCCGASSAGRANRS